MKIACFLYRRRVRWGVIREATVLPLQGAPFGEIKVTVQKIPLAEARLLAPIIPTAKVILAGLNYKDHARELHMNLPSEPVFFIKPTSSVIGPESAIVYPEEVRQLDYEAELAVVIAKEAKAIKESDALSYILGYTCLNDITARDLQKKDVQWTRAKSFDTFCPLGPWIETELDASQLTIRLLLNGETKQCSSTRNLIFPVPFLVSFVSRVMTLFPGDVISTGTPAGVGSLQRGDKVEVEIERIGVLGNCVV